MSKPTQKKKAIRYADAIVDHINESIQSDSLRSLQRRLNTVVDAAQNGPPDGEGDGSIDDELWKMFKAIERSAESFIFACDRFELARRRFE